MSTAEHAVTLLLGAGKSLVANQERLRSGVGDYFVKNEGLEFNGRTLGLAGYGRISRRVGSIMAAMGMEVIAHDPYVTDADAAVELVSWEDLLSRSDALSIHLPFTPETRHRFNAAAFAAMRPGSVLVNTARGGVVDHEALVTALQSGQIGAAGLDVTEPEPLPTDHWLLHQPNVIVTPHIASGTDRGKRRLYQHAIDHALTVLDGGRPDTVLNPEVYDA